MPRVLLIHLTLSAIASAALAAWYDQSQWNVVGHVTVVALGQACLLLLLGLLRSRGDGLWRALLVVAPLSLLTAQSVLYLLHAFAFAYWGRPFTLQILLAYAPGVIDGSEPLPLPRVLLAAALALCGIVQFLLVPLWAPPLAAFLERDCDGALPRRSRAWLPATIGVWVLTAATVVAGIRSDHPVWYTAPIVSFLRSNPVIFEPTLQRRVVGRLDAATRAAYPVRAAGAGQPHVVLIVIDSLRADRLGPYGAPADTAPFLSSLPARGAHVVQRAMATCPESFCGIGSILSSRSFRDLTPQNFTLPEVLTRSGYTPWFLLSGLHLTWYNMGQYYRGDPARTFDGTDSTGLSITDDRRVWQWLDRMPAASDHPVFLHIHLMSVHEGGVLLESPGHSSSEDAGRRRPILRPALSRSVYDASVRQADMIVEGIFDRLDRLGYLERALVVITSDHGEALGRRSFGHAFEVFDEALRIPLLILDPADTEYRNLEYATHLDIAPTIVDRLGLPIPATWAGRSLLRAPVNRMTVHQTYFAPERYAVVYREGRRTWKYMATPGLGEEHLFELESDPREEQDRLSTADPILVARLRGRLQGYLRGENAPARRPSSAGPPAPR
ncbi:MAG: sulfatase [Vicinamibacterales bacterium]|nr:sulfatase [Vicinamibacterales bacterium]